MLIERTAQLPADHSASENVPSFPRCSLQALGDSSLLMGNQTDDFTTTGLNCTDETDSSCKRESYCIQSDSFDESASNEQCSIESVSVQAFSECDKQDVRSQDFRCRNVNKPSSQSQILNDVGEDSLSAISERNFPLHTAKLDVSHDMDSFVVERFGVKDKHNATRKTKGRRDAVSKPQVSRKGITKKINEVESHMDPSPRLRKRTLSNIQNIQAKSPSVSCEPNSFTIVESGYNVKRSSKRKRDKLRDSDSLMEISRIDASPTASPTSRTRRSSVTFRSHRRNANHSSLPILSSIAFETRSDSETNSRTRENQSQHLQSKEGERKSSRNRKNPTFYCEESLVMPSSRPSKFFSRVQKCSVFEWDQMLQVCISKDAKARPAVDTKTSAKSRITENVHSTVITDVADFRHSSHEPIQWGESMSKIQVVRSVKKSKKETERFAEFQVDARNGLESPKIDLPDDQAARDASNVNEKLPIAQENVVKGNEPTEFSSASPGCNMLEDSRKQFVNNLLLDGDPDAKEYGFNLVDKEEQSSLCVNISGRPESSFSSIQQNPHEDFEGREHIVADRNQVSVAEENSNLNSDVCSSVYNSGSEEALSRALQHSDSTPQIRQQGNISGEEGELALPAIVSNARNNAVHDEAEQDSEGGNRMPVAAIHLEQANGSLETTSEVKSMFISDETCDQSLSVVNQTNSDESSQQKTLDLPKEDCYPVGEASADEVAIGDENTTNYVPSSDFLRQTHYNQQQHHLCAVDKNECYSRAYGETLVAYNIHSEHELESTSLFYRKRVGRVIIRWDDREMDPSAVAAGSNLLDERNESDGFRLRSSSMYKNEDSRRYVERKDSRSKSSTLLIDSTEASHSKSDDEKSNLLRERKDWNGVGDSALTRRSRRVAERNTVLYETTDNAKNVDRRSSDQFCTEQESLISNSSKYLTENEPQNKKSIIVRNATLLRKSKQTIERKIGFLESTGQAANCGIELRNEKKWAQDRKQSNVVRTTSSADGAKSITRRRASRVLERNTGLLEANPTLREKETLSVSSKNRIDDETQNRKSTIVRNVLGASLGNAELVSIRRSRRALERKAVSLDATIDTNNVDVNLSHPYLVKQKTPAISFRCRTEDEEQNRSAGSVSVSANRKVSKLPADETQNKSRNLAESISKTKPKWSTGRLYKTDWRVVGDPFPTKASSNGGYLVSFSVALDQYDRYVARGIVERVDFGATIDTAKMAIDEKIAELRSRGEEILHDDSSITEINNHRRSLKLMTSYEDQERLQRAHEKLEDSMAARMREYTRRHNKKSRLEITATNLSRAPIFFERRGDRCLKTSPCAPDCPLCNDLNNRQHQPEPIRSFMPLYRRFNIDDLEDSDEECQNSQNMSRTRSKRAASVSKKGQQSLMKLIELKRTLEFVEQYYVDNRNLWGIVVK